MIKALMMNSARYMTGEGANDTLPSDSQGMGEISLNNYFDIFATAHILRDQVPADLFTTSGQQRLFTGTVSDNSKPFRVTLAWTDAPGSTMSSAFKNNLDLDGNVFSGAFSMTGGSADVRDNFESVVIPAGVSGNFVVRVIATDINSDGVPATAVLWIKTSPW